MLCLTGVRNLVQVRKDRYITMGYFLKRRSDVIFNEKFHHRMFNKTWRWVELSESLRLFIKCAILVFMRHSSVKYLKLLLWMCFPLFITACAFSSAHENLIDHTSDVPKAPYDVHYPQNDGVSPLVGKRVIGASWSKTF